MTTQDGSWVDLGQALKGVNGDPHFHGSGNMTPGGTITLSLRDAKANAPLILVLGLDHWDAPFKNGILVPSTDLLFVGLTSDGNGEFEFDADVESDVPVGAEVYLQYIVADNSNPKKVALSNAILGTVQ
jgi:hypothetical protein